MNLLINLSHYSKCYTVFYGYFFDSEIQKLGSVRFCNIFERRILC